VHMLCLRLHNRVKDDSFSRGEDDEDISAICNLDALVTPDVSVMLSLPSYKHQESSARHVTQEQTKHKLMCFNDQFCATMLRNSNKSCMVSLLKLTLTHRRMLYYLNVLH
jgi:hypothetical protein